MATAATDQTDSGCAERPAALLPGAEAAALAETFKVLSDPTRIRLLHLLAQSESGTACACHMPEALGIAQPTLSFHLRKMLDAGLVEREKRGRWVHWTVRPSALRAAQGFLNLPGVQPADAICAPPMPLMPPIDVTSGA